MKKTVPFVMLISTVFFACHKKNIQSELPACVSKKIEEFKKTACKGSGNVCSYDFQSAKVYVFDKGICIADGGTQVVDENCNNICLLGGISGNMKCKGVLFEKEASNKKVVWKAD